MPAIHMIPDAMRGYSTRLEAEADMLPAEGRLDGFYGPRATQYDAVAPVTQVLEKAPQVFVQLRNDLRDLLNECATAFTEAAAILEGADQASVTQLSSLTAEVEAAATEDATTPGTPAPTAPAPTTDAGRSAKTSGM
ncbi:hypothetical protein AB6N23_16390 [Cellulomonas sp. 179-A 9B4 NHS]|uniref:hypothetical protein n=1 Tax=Cellulomonas sp. 179-A 9B4 NHS TaxID=3142379 RepID=UPI0039A0F4D2